jgi:hypothetical protein
MAKKEANFDLYIHELLKDAGISAVTQGSTSYRRLCCKWCVALCQSYIAKDIIQKSICIWKCR